MGEAKRRGSYEERITQSLNRKRQLEESEKEKARLWWESLSDEERAQQRKIWRDKRKKQQEVSRIFALAMSLSAGAR